MAGTSDPVNSGDQEIEIAGSSLSDSSVSSNTKSSDEDDVDNIDASFHEIDHDVDEFEVDSDSSEGSHDEVSVDGPSTLPLFEGRSVTVLEALAGYFNWFSNHPSISKSALSSLLNHEHFNVLPPGNNLPSSYEQVYNVIKPHLVPTVCYRACPNDCIQF